MKKSVYISLFAALISVGAFIQIPLPLGVPIVIQDMMAILSGFLLGPLYGSLAVLVFLVLGSIGLPVFTGKAGIQVILHGLTGGFLVGYLAAALFAGFFAMICTKIQKSITEKKVLSPKSGNLSLWILYSVGTVFAFTIIFALGIFQFMSVSDSSFQKAIFAVLIPFLPGTLVKIFIIIPIAKKFRPIMLNYI